MFLDIKLDKNTPVYIQIKDYIKDMILRGMIRSGEKLPSTRELSSVLKVSRNTIICAYQYLEEEGFVYMQKGKGAFIADIKINPQEKWSIDWGCHINNLARVSQELDIVKHEAKWKKGMISFKSIAPDQSLFDIEEVKRAFLNRLSIEGEKILNYGYAQGYKPLIEYLLKYMKNKGVNVQGKNLIITNGFTEGFDLILSCLTNNGDKILCENPTHNTAIKIMKLHNLEVVGIDMDRDGINIDKLKRTLEKDNFKLSYLIPSYHNPTGIVMSAEKRVEVYKILRDYNIPIIEDGFNEELRYSGTHVSPIAALSGEGNSVIYIGSFSKILFPGMRIGWILGDSKLIDYLESVKRARNIHTSSLDQAIFYEYLQGGTFERYIKKSRKVYKEKYEYAVECAKKYILCSEILGEGGLHIFIKLNGIDAREVLDQCCKRGVIFTPGDIFYTDNKGKNTLRLGFSRVSKKHIEDGFKIIGEVVAALQEGKP
ncbi:PLP-dependent aminotransferase family protein [Clostridium sp. DJ247]|uniref:MocR-like pyridoxine biosynthesis transcription factor PdxR n=1 Tax=Clostridium sp. DJ247 TaxID=2726188 RepID=UPI001626958C|nr:PLP-dependent aminotransferase family protein [Clostridium sp. DJ247]MBC2580798.1 PLP-dependent aminotransferase family protein [Clostridium sp. DJ247]